MMITTFCVMTLTLLKDTHTYAQNVFTFRQGEEVGEITSQSKKDDFIDCNVES